MLTLIYGPYGEDVNDFNYEKWIANVVSMPWATENIELRVSTRLPILLVQIAIVKEDIFPRFVRFGTLEDLECGFKPYGFTKYGLPRRDMLVFKEGVYRLTREFLQLRAKREAKDKQADPKQSNLF